MRVNGQMRCASESPKTVERFPGQRSMIEPRSDPSMDIGGGKKEGKKSFGVQITTGQKLKKYGRRNPAQFRVLKGAPRTSTVPSFWSGVLRTSRGRGGRLDGGQSPSVAAGWVQGWASIRAKEEKQKT